MGCENFLNLDEGVYYEHMKLFFVNLESKKEEEVLKVLMNAMIETIFLAMMDRLLNTSNEKVKLTPFRAMTKKKGTF